MYRFTLRIVSKKTKKKPMFYLIPIPLLVSSSDKDIREYNVEGVIVWVVNIVMVVVRVLREKPLCLVSRVGTDALILSLVTLSLHNGIT